jgi:NADH:ubiquinone oxidoreductase subunit 5 (subunit L)/multisubunit Na+/H+ antiporter MnhA subunit
MNLPEDLAWVILVLPLLAAGGITLFTLSDRGRSARWSIVAVVLSFVLSVALFLSLRGGPVVSATPWTWLEVGGLRVVFAPVLDPLSLLFCRPEPVHLFHAGHCAGQ